MDLNKIHQGHALDILKTFPNASVNMCITSPPYWGLRDYKTDSVKWDDGWLGELGTESDVNAYINHLCDIFDEVKRVLKDDGTCWVNIGDTYHNKNLCLIPFCFALEMSNRGWIVRNVIIWQKPNATPQSAKDRFTVDFEYLLFFSKNKKYYFEQQFEPFQNSTLQRGKRKFSENKSHFYQGYGRLQQQKFHQKVLNESLPGRNMRTVWNIPTKSYHGAHFAVFPPDLIEIPVKSGCPKDGIVLDPFIGSGTTAIVANKLNRRWLGIELNSEYIKLAEHRISQNT